jgi:hypothetical protein
VPATSVEKSRFRQMLAGSVDSMPDAYLDDDVFAQAEADYAGYPRTVIFYAALVRGVSDLMMRAALEVDYDEGDASEKLSQKYKALKDLKAQFEKRLADELLDANPYADWLPFGPTPMYRERPDEL